jgi:transcriptional regulator with GAF, ATPase, and Fis domain
MHEIDEEQFARAWAQSGFEPAGTARLLGVSRQSVYRRIDGLAGYRLAGQVDKAELRQVLASCEADSARAARHLRVSLSALRAVLRGTDLEWR